MSSFTISILNTGIQPNAPQINTGTTTTLELSVTYAGTSEVTLSAASWLKLEFPDFLQDSMKDMEVSALNEKDDWHCECLSGTPNYFKLQYTGTEAVFPSTSLIFQFNNVLCNEQPVGKNETITLTPNQVGGISKYSQTELHLLPAEPLPLNEMLLISLANSQVFISTDGTPLQNELRLNFLNIRQDGKPLFTGENKGNPSVKIWFDYDENKNNSQGSHLTDVTTAKENINAKQIAGNSEWKTEQATALSHGTDTYWLLSPQSTNILDTNENVVIQFSSIFPNAIVGDTYMHVEILNFPEEDGTIYPNNTYSLGIEKKESKPVIDLDISYNATRFNWAYPENIELLFEWGYQEIYRIEIINTWDNSLVFTKTYDGVYGQVRSDRCNCTLDLSPVREDSNINEFLFEIRGYGLTGNLKKANYQKFIFPPRILLDISPNYLDWLEFYFHCFKGRESPKIKATVRIGLQNISSIDFDKTHIVISLIDGLSSISFPLRENDGEYKNGWWEAVLDYRWFLTKGPLNDVSDVSDVSDVIDVSNFSDISDLAYSVITVLDGDHHFTWKRIPNILHLLSNNIITIYKDDPDFPPEVQGGFIKSFFFDSIKIDGYIRVARDFSLRCGSFQFTQNGHWEWYSNELTFNIEATEEVLLDGYIDYNKDVDPEQKNSVIKKTILGQWPNNQEVTIQWNAKFGKASNGSQNVSPSKEDNILFGEQDQNGDLWLFGFVFEARGLHAILIKNDFTIYKTGSVLSPTSTPAEISRVSLPDNPDFYFECNYQ